MIIGWIFMFCPIHGYTLDMDNLFWVHMGGSAMILGSDIVATTHTFSTYKGETFKPVRTLLLTQTLVTGELVLFGVITRFFLKYGKAKKIMRGIHMGIGIASTLLHCVTLIPMHKTISPSNAPTPFIFGYLSAGLSFSSAGMMMLIRYVI
jgi:hypothetical protein